MRLLVRLCDCDFVYLCICCFVYLCIITPRAAAPPPPTPAAVETSMANRQPSFLDYCRLVSMCKAHSSSSLRARLECAFALCASCACSRGFPVRLCARLYACLCARLCDCAFVYLCICCFVHLCIITPRAATPPQCALVFRNADRTQGWLASTALRPRLPYLPSVLEWL